MRRIIWLAIIAVLAGVVHGEMQRPQLTLENRFTEVMRPEITLQYEKQSYEVDPDAGQNTDADVIFYKLMGRMNVLDNLALTLDIPYVDIQQDFGDDDKGWGDIVIGAQLRVYEYIFDYPYVIPHVEFALDDSGKDNEYGYAEPAFRFGTSVGTVVHDWVHFIADVSLTTFDDKDDVVDVALSTIWDVDETFSVVAEGLYRENTDENAQDTAIRKLQAGMIYEPMENLSFGVYGSKAWNSGEDTVFTLKSAYSFK